MKVQLCIFFSIFRKIIKFLLFVPVFALIFPFLQFPDASPHWKKKLLESDQLKQLCPKQ